MKIKHLLITGLAVAMLGSTSIYPSESQAAEKPSINQFFLKTHELSDEAVKQSVQDWVEKQSYVQRGGEGEYRTFQYKGMTYRYLSKDIDTKTELVEYLTETVTNSLANSFIKDMGIIEHQGKMAQLEADGGSLLQWDQAKVQLEKKFGTNTRYKIIVPVGETGDLEVYKVELKYVFKQGWKINSFQFSHQVVLDVPFNINPAFIFFKYLLVDEKESEDQLINKEVFNTKDFKKGITKLEVRTLEEQGRIDDQVDFKATFHVELDKNYKGSLKNGLNELYFLVENMGESEYKIANIDTAQHIITIDPIEEKEQ